MSTITTTPLPMESPWPLYKLSVDQYEAMVESGIFTERDRAATHQRNAGGESDSGR